MVMGVPRISITKKPGYGSGSEGTDRIWGICVETIKGKPFTPTLVTSPNQMYDDFKVDNINGIWGVGGQGVQVVRVTVGTPKQALHHLLDTAATGVNVMDLKAKTVGSYQITFSATSTPTGGNNITIREEGFSPEYYLGVQTIQELVNQINRYSRIAEATFVAEGTGRLATVAENTVLGSGVGNIAGSDGDTKSGTDKPEDKGELKNIEGDREAVTAHLSGLSMLEIYDIKGVFTVSNEATVQDVYAQHALNMNTPRVNKWRYACVGATTTDDTKEKILARTAAYNNEFIIFVGQGLIAYDEKGDAIEYPAYKATQAFAGKRSHLEYYEPVFGGDARKLLAYNGVGFFTDVMPMVNENTITTEDDWEEYNEKGVITFTKELDGVRIKEGVTTVQPDNLEMQSQESVVSIVIHAMEVIYKYAKQMIGRGMTNTFKTDIEQFISQGLEEMKVKDFSLIDLPDEQLQAYTVTASMLPRASQRKGQISVSASIVPIYAAREIDIPLMVF